MNVNKLIPPEEDFLVRTLSNEKLHYWLARTPEGEAQIALERELRRREAWAAPAGRAFWISILSIVVSGGALATSLLK